MALYIGRPARSKRNSRMRRGVTDGICVEILGHDLRRTVTRTFCRLTEERPGWYWRRVCFSD